MNTELSIEQLYHKQRLGVVRINLLVAVLHALTAAHAVAGYLFTPFVDTTGEFLDFGATPPPSLNASGVIAFRATLDDGRRGVFSANGTTTTTIAVSARPFTTYGNPVINQAGTVAFHVDDRPPASIMTGNGGPLVTIADTTGQFSNFAVNPSINAAGTVAFNAGLTAGGGGIFLSNGGVTTQTGILHASSSAINDAGTLSLSGYFNGHYFIGTSSGGPTTVIADDTGPLKVFGSRPALSNTGTVAFVAGLVDQDTGAYGIYSGSGGALTTIADLSGPFSYFDLYFGQPSINGTGTVAFTAGLDAGGYGLFTGNGVTTNEIIGTGDALFGSTVTSVGISTTAFNDSGQLAFYYQLANGIDGIALATPTPEPSTTMLLVSSALLALRRRRR